MNLILQLVAVTALILYCARLIFRRPSAAAKLPPGPYPFPIIGNIHQLGRFPHRTLTQLSHTHGPLMSLHLGSIYTVVVSSADVAKKVFTKHDQTFCSRNIPVAARARDHHKISMAFLPIGAEWRRIRKVSKEHLFSGARLDASEELRREKVQQLHEYVQKCADAGREVDIAQAVSVTGLNLMLATLFSAEVTEFDSRFSQEFSSILEGLVSVVGEPNLADFFPVLQWMDPQGIKKRSELHFGRMLAFIEGLIKQRVELRATSPDRPKNTDFLETLLDLAQGSEFSYTLNDIAHLLLDFFAGGTDAAATVSEWAMTELLANPDKLAKAKQELRTVIGESHKHLLQVQESDIARLPYLQAVIKEVLRYHVPGPLLIPHKSEQQIEINGYTIPKGTQLVVNAWAIARDPNNWSNPDTFEPERFLDNKIDFKGYDFEFLPFSAGRRICPGLPLADRMLHMILATFIHHFDWQLPSNLKPGQVDTTEKFGLTLRKDVPLMAIPIIINKVV